MTILKNIKEYTANVKRELKEETGLSSSNYIYLGLYHESPSSVQNGLHCFIATDCEKKDNVQLEEYETIEGCIYTQAFQLMHHYIEV